MAALTTNRPTDRAGVQVVPNRASNPIADNVHIYQGAITQADGNGNIVPGGLAAQADTHTFRTLGRAYKEYDNTVVGHAAGALTVESEFGAFLLDISAGDAVTQADVGNSVYLVDDHTIGKTNAGGTLAVAGKLLGLATVGEFAGTQAIVWIGPSIP
jgi:hypothetical protein